MLVAAAQLNVKWEEPDLNFDAAEKLIETASSEGCEMVCLPELFSTGVTLNPERFAEDVKGRTCIFLSSQARMRKIYVVGSFIEKNGGKDPLNSLVVFDKAGKIACKYSKMNLFKYGGEHKAYSSGSKHTSFSALGFKIFPYICYDLRFPSLFTDALKLGADFFIVCANWPNPRREHWVTLLRARAIETQSYVMGVNMVGASPKNTFFGASMIVSPHGDILSMGKDDECVVSAEVAPSDVSDYRGKFNPEG